MSTTTTGDLRLLLLANPHAPAGLVAGFGASPDPELRAAAASPSATPELLGGLACDTDEYVRRAVAASVLSAPGLLTGLAEDKDEKIRIAVAANPATGTGVIETLASDPGKAVRGAAAGNPRCPRWSCSRSPAATTTAERAAFSERLIQTPHL